MAIALIGAPTSLGAFAPGQEQAPRALREAGLRADADFGDIPLRRWRPDREHRRAQNAAGVATAAREVAERVEAAFRAGKTPVVLGGDCTVEHRHGGRRSGGRRAPRARLLRPPSRPQHAGDGRHGHARLDGRRAHARRCRGRCPSWPGSRGSPPSDVLLFARQDDQTRPGEREAIEAHGIESIMVEEVAADPRAAATRASQRFGRYLVHFDVDVVDFVDLPLSENTGHNIGLPFDAAARRSRCSWPARASPASPSPSTIRRTAPRTARRPPALAAALQRALSFAASRPSGAPQSSIEAGAGMP